MLRLAATLLLLLLMLFGAAAWLLELTPTFPQPEQQAKQQDKPKSGLDEALDIQESLQPSAPPADGAPAFDVARIDPNGTSVFAGRAEPRSVLTITADGKEIGTVEADENGEWTFTTEKIANPDAKLALFKASPEAVARLAEAAKPKPPAAEPARPQTAGAVTSSMLKNLEGMVAEARANEARLKEEQQAAAAATPPSPAAPVPPPPLASESSAPTPAPAAGESSTATTAQPAAPAPAAPASVAPTAPQATVSASVPVPITFVYNEATLTPEGRRAATLLLEYLQLKRFPKVTLTGHADERGTHALNMNLSSERLETVANFLRDGGFAGQLELVPKGKTEPYTGVVRSEFSQEDLWQLDRRVELVVSR